MADISSRDENRNVGIQGVSTIDLSTPTNIAVNPTTKRLQGDMYQGTSPWITDQEMWAIQHQPGSGSTATISKAAGGGTVRHFCSAISATVGCSTAPVATDFIVNLRDGATGAGTILMSWNLALQATAGDRSGVVLSGLNIAGSANTAMTLEFTGGATSCIEHVALVGYDKAV